MNGQGYKGIRYKGIRHLGQPPFILAHSVAAQAAKFTFNYEFLITNFECEALASFFEVSLRLLGFASVTEVTLTKSSYYV